MMPADSADHFRSVLARTRSIPAVEGTWPLKRERVGMLPLREETLFAHCYFRWSWASPDQHLAFGATLPRSCDTCVCPGGASAEFAARRQRLLGWLVYAPSCSSAPSFPKRPQRPLDFSLGGGADARSTPASCG